MRIGDACVARGLRDLLDASVELLDVAGVHTDGRAAGLDGGEDVPGLEMDVGDDRDLALLRDGRERVGVLLPRAGDTDDVAARRREFGDLLQGGVDVVGLGGAHRLHGYREVAADSDSSDLELASLAAGCENGGRAFGHTQSDRAGHVGAFFRSFKSEFSDHWKSLIGLTMSAVRVRSMYAPPMTITT